MSRIITIDGEEQEISEEAFVALVPPVSYSPAPVVEVSMMKARMALRQVGKLAAVQAAVDAMPSPEGDDARIAWEYAMTVRIDHPLVIALKPAVGITDAEMQAIFDAAAAIPG